MNESLEEDSCHHGVEMSQELARGLQVFESDRTTTELGRALLPKLKGTLETLAPAYQFRFCEKRFRWSGELYELVISTFLFGTEWQVARIPLSEFVLERAVEAIGIWLKRPPTEELALQHAEMHKQYQLLQDRLFSKPIKRKFTRGKKR